jgi:1-acyl-sn-glycerol-3-phosphate acyltransferase
MKVSFDFGSRNFHLPDINFEVLSRNISLEKLRENRLLFSLYQIYKYIFFLPFLGISTCVLVILCLSFTFITRSKINRQWPIFWARLNSLMTPIFVKVTGGHNIDPDQSYVIAANHQSQYDIFVVYGWFPSEFRWVMKKELRKIPFLGYFCYKAGHVFIDRSNTESALKSINEAKKQIKNGTCILFFPEGTRSDSGQLKEFKKGAFRFALDMGLPILPVTIVGTRNVLPSNTLDLFPGRATMIIHKPIDTGGYHEENLNELMLRVRSYIQKGLDDYS